VAGDPVQFAGDVARPQDVIDVPIADGRAGHAGTLGRLLVLSELDTADRLDCLQRDGTIAAVSRQHHAGCPALLDGGQRSEQMIDRHVLHRSGGRGLRARWPSTSAIEVPGEMT